MFLVTAPGRQWPQRRSLPSFVAVADVTLALAPVVAALLALGAYLLTLSPSISWADGLSDSGELAAAAYVLGVPHPTTYPLYMILGWAVSHLPFGEPAYDLNLLSALCGALTAGLVAVLARALGARSAVGRGDELHGRRLRGRQPSIAACGPLMGGLIFAAVPAFWIQATGSETRTLAAALGVAVLVALVYGLHLGSRQERQAQQMVRQGNAFDGPRDR